MNRTSVTLPQELVDDLLELTQCRNKTQAITVAIQEEIRRRKLAKIREAAGDMDFEIKAEALRHGDERTG